MSGPARRMLTEQEAADYCGFSSVNGFKAHIRVRPVNFGKLVRYDRADLDAYLDRLRSSPGSGNILELAGNEGARRGA
jgi:hypothetical protein